MFCTITTFLVFAEATSLLLEYLIQSYFVFVDVDVGARARMHLLSQLYHIITALLALNLFFFFYPLRQYSKHLKSTHPKQRHNIQHNYTSYNLASAINAQAASTFILYTSHLVEASLQIFWASVISNHRFPASSCWMPLSQPSLECNPLPHQTSAVTCSAIANTLYKCVFLHVFLFSDYLILATCSKHNIEAKRSNSQSEDLRNAWAFNES